MIRLNNLMEQKVPQINFRRPLNETLLSIGNDGFTEKNNSYYMISFLNIETNLQANLANDELTCEVFINSLHAEDYDSEDPLSQAIVFVAFVLAKWRESSFGFTLLAIIIVSPPDEECDLDSTDSVVVKFHLQRPGKNWLADDLSKYQEAVMEVSSDVDLLKYLCAHS